jgi:hypothetical protein
LPFRLLPPGLAAAGGGKWPADHAQSARKHQG